MFSLTSSVVNSQIALPIYNLSQLSFCRPLLKRNVNSTIKDKQIVSNTQENRAVTELCIRLNLNRMDKDMPKLLRQCALYGPSKQSVNHKQTRKYSQLLVKRIPWHENHTSCDTFSENKVALSRNKCIFSEFSRKWKNTNSLLLVARSFKTKRSIPNYEQETIPFKSSIELKGIASHFAGEQKQKLASLLESEQSEDSQKKIKVAFAEGYISGGGNKVASLKIHQFFRNILLFGVPLAIILYLGRKLKFFSLQMNMSNKEVNPTEINVTFDDVQGAEEAKQELQEVVEFLKNPNKYTGLGAELPKGVLLVGPPGTGKTLLARAVAGEAKVPFFHAAGAEFDEVLVGQGARRVRELFSSAKRKAPCVIFIDEVDSVGAKRTSSVLHPYANQTINQLLAEMDGFVKNEGVIVLGATNRRENLDKALLRPGRFDVEIQVPVPDLAERKQLFQYYLGKIKLGRDVDLQVLARGCTGFTGADIKNIVNQAALRAASDEVDNVSMMYLELARDKVLMGPEKKHRIPDEDANLITAYHEGGHTLVSYFTKDSIPLHKVTIIRRGSALGHTAFIPEKEQYYMTKSQMLAMMDSLMGGRAAEEIIFGQDKLTTGGASDLERATSIAEIMVKGYGMSEKVGLRTFKEPSDQLISIGDNLSVTTKESIDSEIRILLQDSYDRAKNLLKLHSKEHKALAEALMKYETLDSNDIKIILEGRQLSKNI